MSEALKKFLSANMGNYDAAIEHKFVTGLKNSSGTAEGLQRIRTAVFEVARSAFETPEGAAALDWVQKFLDVLEFEAYQPLVKQREALFFPSEQSEQRLIHWLDSAQKELLVCVFTITNNDLRNALHRAHDRGVKVRVISDDECMKQIGSDVYALKTYGIEVESDTNPDAHMHNKYCVIDDLVIITGSFNWTCSAVDKNNENLTVLACPELAVQYKRSFNDLWQSFKSATISMSEAQEHVQADRNRYRGGRGGHRGGDRGGHGGRGGHHDNHRGGHRGGDRGGHRGGRGNRRG